MVDGTSTPVPEEVALAAKEAVRHVHDLVTESSDIATPVPNVTEKDSAKKGME